MMLSPAITGILPRGEGELVEHFIDRCNRQFLADLEARQHELRALPLEERIARALQLRLQLLAPYVDSWPQALAVAARPSNAPHGLRLLFALVDDVWAALGDESTDLTWYSKRALLAGAYSSSSLYMMTDYSPGFADTWAALRRRVGEALSLDASLAGALHAATAAAASASGPSPSPPPPAAEPATAAASGGGPAEQQSAPAPSSPAAPVDGQ
ncbi:hypothetical protein GPECTOR_30g281 [Gonium pectorale]|uniref:Ubiquinone biosynthesis protein n=1 Tax=Gonium pectorale TaxID=33097 RepID=A0A150GF34_GONPE|nr:hypothetical protein GPECTOR_30g281 [Gonium pectorale]|eukprot:KXZ48185.1 hypothetical protein GPECTOR_30g281 [Gonium pectorale]